MRSPIICFIFLAVAVLLVTQSVVAQVTPLAGTVHRIPFIRAGPVWSLSPFESAGLFILEVNTSHLAVSDTEAFALSFQPVAGGAPGPLAIAPAIAQTSSCVIAADRSYFFRDFEEL